MNLRVVAFEPLPEKLMALKAQARYDARPIEAGAAIVALLRVRQVELRVNQAVREMSFRRAIRAPQKGRGGAEQNESCLHSYTISCGAGFEPPTFPAATLRLRHFLHVLGRRTFSHYQPRSVASLVRRRV